MKSNELARLALIVVAAGVFIFLIHNYNNGANNVGGNNNAGNNNQVVNNVDITEGFYADGENTQEAPNNNGGMVSETETVADSDADVLASEPEGNETFKAVETTAAENNAGNNGEAGNRLPNECYPKDVLTPDDLLPQDANSTWAQTVPNGQGNLGDQNFLNAGFHVGINTVGQSLRNANLQLRSEPPNPQLKVSPWLQTTIEPDVNRKAFEIGEQ